MTLKESFYQALEDLKKPADLNKLKDHIITSGYYVFTPRKNYSTLQLLVNIAEEEINKPNSIVDRVHLETGSIAYVLKVYNVNSLDIF